MLTVCEAMKFGGLSKCSLLAGSSGLGREITCVDSMEVPNIEPWLRRGELVITTGYAFKDDENAVSYLIKALSNADASALAIKTRFLGEIKDEDIKLANQLGFPIFEIPSDMPLVEMLMPVVRVLTNRQIEAMEFSEKIHKQFTEIELSEGGFDKISDTLSMLLQMPAAVTDSRGSILASNITGFDFNGLEEFISNNKLLQSSKTTDCIVGSKNYTVFNRPVSIRTTPKGHILVFCPQNTLNEMQLIILDHSVTTAALEFSKQDSIRDNTNQMNTALFLDLIMRNISSPKEAEYRTEKLKWPRPPLSMVTMDVCNFKEAIVGLSEQDILEKKNLISDSLHQYIPQGIVISHSDSFVCIFHECTDAKSILNTINRSCRKIKETSSWSFTTSVINHVQDYLSVAEAYSEARNMLDIARMIGKSGQVLFSGDLIREQAYLRSTDNPYIRKYCKDTLDILRSYDAENASFLLETLEIYTSCLGIKTKAAEALNLHRNTLSFRLEKIENLLSIDLNDPKTIMFLNMAINISKYY